MDSQELKRIIEERFREWDEKLQDSHAIPMILIGLIQDQIELEYFAGLPSEMNTQEVIGVLCDLIKAILSKRM